MDFPGYALGGFSVGETPQQMVAALAPSAALLPEGKPRYLMGVGRPRDLLDGIAAGIDMFDCVMPTRSGRNALAFVDAGVLRLRNACHRRDPAPLEAGLSVLRLRPLQPGLPAPPVRRRGDARADPADHPQRDLLPAAHGAGAAAIERGAFAAFRAGCLARWGQDGRVEAERRSDPTPGPLP